MSISSTSAPAEYERSCRKGFLRRATVFGAAVMALVLAGTNLGTRSLWLDEAYSAGLATLDWYGLGKDLILREANMGLYYVLLKLWIGLFGTSEAAIRSLSVLTSAATLPILYLIGARLFNFRVAITATLLLAANPFFIRYAQEARAYSLVLFLASLAGYYFLRYIEAPSKTNRALYICSSALAGYAHFFALLIPVCHICSVPFMKRGTTRPRDLVLTFSILGFLLAPLAVYILANDSGQLDWVPPLDLLSLPRLFFAFSGLVDLPLVAVYLFLFPLGLVSMLQQFRNRDFPRETGHAAFTVIWLALPVAMVMGVSLLKPIFITRYFMVSFPPFILITALGLTAAARRVRYHICVAAVVILSINAVCTSYRASTVADWKSACALIFSSSLPDDALVISQDKQSIPYAYCRNTAAPPLRAPVQVYPTAPLRELYGINDNGPPDLPRVTAAVAGRNRAWLLICDDTPHRLFGYFSLLGTVLHPVPLSGTRPENEQSARLRTTLQTGYRHQREWRFERIRLYLLYNGTETEPSFSPQALSAPRSAP